MSRRSLFIGPDKTPGTRATEIGLLQVSDLDFKRMQIRVHRLKGSFGGEHLMQPDETKALKAWLKSRPYESPYVFTSNRRDPISRFTFGAREKEPTSAFQY